MFFFFSSRRRHTRSLCDWSSDVCSSDLLIPTLYSYLGDTERTAVNEELFSRGAALGWLTSVLRAEIFKHGRFGDRKSTPDRWRLPEAEFNRACDIMLARYQSMSMAEILATPESAHIL